MTTTKTCDHPDKFTASEWWVYGQTEGVANPSNTSAKDWDFARAYLQAKVKADFDTPAFYDELERFEKATAIRLCAECYFLLPSQRQKRERLSRPSPSKEEKSEIAQAKERMEAGEAMYWCSECSELREQEELCQVRECPHCEETFNGSEEGRNCPSCNRPFSRLVVQDNGCPECLSENECELLTLENWQALVGSEA